jgi:AsmA protein
MRLVGSTLGVERFALDPARRSFAISDLKLRVKGSRSGNPLALDLDWPELDVSGDTLKGSALAGKLSFGDALPLSVTFKSDAPSGSFDNVRVPAFEARLSSAATARRIVGGLRSELVLQPERRAALLDKIDLNLRLDEPGLKPLTLALKGIATATAGIARWSLAGDLNANAFSTEGSASLAGITPTVKTLVRFGSLDLNALLEASASGSSAAADSAPIDLAPLRSVNGSLGLRIGSLALRQYRATDVALDATLDAGMLRVSSFRGQAWGGTLEGGAFADARASRVALKASADGVNLPSVLKDLVEKDLLDGTGRIEVDIESAGRTRGELKARLKGAGSLQLRDGAVKGVNLARSLRTAKTALSLKQDALVRASRTERTDFSELDASFRIDAGVARSNDLALKSPLLRLAGDTAVDIVKGRVDSHLNTTLADTLKGQDGAELAALRGVTLPVHLSGPFDDLQWKLEWSAAVASAVKSPVRTEIDRRVRDRIAPRAEPRAPAAAPAPSSPSAEDRLNNKLKGLLP